MVIREICGFVVGCELEKPIANSTHTKRDRHSFLVRVETDCGLHGWGEAHASPWPAAAYARAVLAPILLGEDSADPVRVWRRMMGTRGDDRRGVAMQAISALDMAIWDCKGKAEKRPVSSLLGGALRKSVPAYASGPFMSPGREPYREFPALVDELLEAGFRALKPRVGVTPAKDADMAAALRKQVGNTVPLMFDFNQGYTVRAAMDAIRRMEDAGVGAAFIEEPLVSDDLPGYCRLAQALLTPIAAGEALSGLAAFRDLFSAGAVAYVNPDIATCGGFTGGMQISALAEAFEIPYLPHVWGTAVNFRASLQFAAVLPEYNCGFPWPCPMIEYDSNENPLLRLTGAAPALVDGRLEIPEEPGIGIDLEPGLLSKYLKEQWRVAL